MVKQAKYLGITIDEKLNYNAQMEKWKNKVKNTRKKFRMMGYHERDKWKTKLVLWHAYLKS